MTHKKRTATVWPSLHHSRKRKARPDEEIIRELPEACASEAKAVEFVEKMRWSGEPKCPRCGSTDVKAMVGADGARNARFLWRCYECKKAKRLEQFTVRIGTVYEESRLPLTVWTKAMWMTSSAKNGCSALELSRIAHCTPKTALFVLHRLREAMATDWSPEPKMTGNVVADETAIGPKFRTKEKDTLGRVRTRTKGKNRDKGFVIAVVNQKTGETRTRVVRRVTAWNLAVALRANVDFDAARLVTDTHKGYRKIGKKFELGHSATNHSIHEYVRYEPWGVSSTNPAEAFFSRLKRQIAGTYHSVSVKHLARYASHAEFLMNSRELPDGERFRALVKRADGKRLRYEDQVG